MVGYDTSSSYEPGSSSEMLARRRAMPANAGSTAAAIKTRPARINQAHKDCKGESVWDASAPVVGFKTVRVDVATAVAELGVRVALVVEVDVASVVGTAVALAVLVTVGVGVACWAGALRSAPFERSVIDEAAPNDTECGWLSTG